MNFIDLAAQQNIIRPQIDAAIKRVLDHGKYIMGPEVAELESQLNGFCGAKYAITCASGTDALLMVLMAQGIGPKDAVFVPSFTFAATAEVVALLGAQPVFVDVLPDTFNMDPASLEQAITVAREKGLNPKAVIPVDMFGQPADYDVIEKIAADNDLWILSDAAQSFGASYKGRKVGTIGLATTTSFFPAKPLGCYGDGGCIFTDNSELAEKLISIRVHGKGSQKYDNVRLGINGRLDTIQAAILLEKLKIFPEELLKRQQIADRYNNELSELFKVPVLQDNVTSAWAQYTTILDEQHDRATMISGLKDKGVPTVVYYPKPLHMQTAYRGCVRAMDDLSCSEMLSGKVLSLPMHPYVDQEKIISCVIAVLRRV